MLKIIVRRLDNEVPVINYLVARLRGISRIQIRGFIARGAKSST